MEVIATVTLSKATSTEYVKLREIWNDSLARGEMPEYVTTHEDIDAMIALIHYLVTKEKVIFDPLKELKIAKEMAEKIYTQFEKSVMTVAKNDFIFKLLHNRDTEKRKLRGNSLKGYLSHVIPEGRMDGGYVVAKAIYDAEINRLNTRANRVKNSPKVKELASKYPDIDIQSIVAVSLLKDKIQLVQDDLDWIEQIVKIACNIQKR